MFRPTLTTRCLRFVCEIFFCSFTPRLSQLTSRSIVSGKLHIGWQRYNLKFMTNFFGDVLIVVDIREKSIKSRMFEGLRVILGLQRKFEGLIAGGH